MVELGDKEDELNEAFGKEAAKCCDKIFLIGDKQTRAIRKGIEGEAFPENDLYVYEDFGEAMKKIYSIGSEKRKIILLENDLPDNY